MSEQANAAASWGAHDEPAEVTALKPVFARLIVRQLDQNQALTAAERQAADLNIYKEQMRAAFLTNPLATPADFERLWPRLRDNDLCDHAVLTYGQVMEALSRDVDAGKLLHDYLGAPPGTAPEAEKRAPAKTDKDRPNNNRGAITAQTKTTRKLDQRVKRAADSAMGGKQKSGKK
jgi:hypothetical protein